MPRAAGRDARATACAFVARRDRTSGVFPGGILDLLAATAAGRSHQRAASLGVRRDGFRHAIASRWLAALGRHRPRAPGRIVPQVAAGVRLPPSRRRAVPVVRAPRALHHRLRLGRWSWHHPPGRSRQGLRQLSACRHGADGLQPREHLPVGAQPSAAALEAALLELLRSAGVLHLHSDHRTAVLLHRRRQARGRLDSHRDRQRRARLHVHAQRLVRRGGAGVAQHRLLVSSPPSPPGCMCSRSA